MSQEQFHLEIILKETLPAGWEDWFDGLNLAGCAGGDTLLSGDVTDQAALHGVFERIRDLNLRLVSVQVWTR
jgi:hypothetical protein